MNIRLEICWVSALAKTYPAGPGEGSIAAGAGVLTTSLEAVWLEAIWLETIRPGATGPETPPGNRNATISAGESSEVRTGSAPKLASMPAAAPAPTTAKHAHARLRAR